MLKPIARMVGLAGRGITVVMLAVVVLGLGGGGAATAARTSRPDHAALPATRAGLGVADGASPHPGSPPTVAVGGNPIGDAVDQATHTVYVANNADNTVSLLDAATCNAKHTAGCGTRSTTVKIGVAPIGDAVDQKTDTVYVVDTGDGTVSVIDGKTCNAEVTAGCGKVHTIHVGGGPNVDAIDEQTDTIYVANSNDDTVSVIDGARCNSAVTSGCGDTPPVVHVGGGPDGVGVDPKTNTVYATNFNDGTVSVIDGATCDSTVTSGCGQKPAMVTVGGSPDGALVDDATHTVYAIAGGAALGWAAMIDTATCDGTHHSGCSRTPARAQVGSAPIWIAENPATRTIYVANQEDSDVSVLNPAKCNARSQSGCTKPLPAIAAAFEAGAVDVDVATNTMYYSSQALNTISVLNGATCNATHTHGCTRFAPTTTVGLAPQGLAVNQRTNTVYVGNRDDNDLSVISAARCNAGQRRRCGRPWPTVATGVTPQAVAVNELTDTVYTANSDPDNGGRGDTVSVMDGATCNAHTISGCGRSPGAVKVGDGPYALAVNARTNTIYVANGNDNTVSVIDGATCDAARRSGCGQTPATISVPAGDYVGGIDVDQHTNTVYVEVASQNTGVGGVWVINGATCDGTLQTGCSTHSTASIGADIYPSGVHINTRTDTVYVVDSTPSGDGRVAAIDGDTCNARVTHGCDRAPATLRVDSPAWLVLDQATDTLFVDSILESNVQVFNAATCNAKITSGCGQKPASVPVGGWPGALGVDQANDTFYVAQNVDGEVSFFRGHPHR
jgi:YVTN family beta-propeller protein